MHKLRYGLIVLGLLLSLATSSTAGVSIGIGLPSVSIGINLPLFPELVLVPGYPVYYAPRMEANYFFYDGMYWVYQDDNWYASSWYNGPWGFVEPAVVPLYILRVPVSYYRQPPVYFRGWQSNAPPRWGQHWGRGWEQRRGGWDKWKRSSAPAPAPLPVYQRQYSGDKYPHVEQQQKLRSEQYRYQPRDKVVREHLTQVKQNTPAPAQRGRPEAPPVRRPEPVRSTPALQNGPSAPNAQPQQRGGDNLQRTAPAQSAPEHRVPAVHEQKQPSPPGHDQNQQPGAEQHEQQAPRPQNRGDAQEGHGQGQRNDEEHGRGRNR